MEIFDFDNITDKTKLFEKDSNGREINVYKLIYAVPTGESLYYPNTLFHTLSENKLYKPIKENTMSLKDVSDKTTFEHEVSEFDKTYQEPVFFFVYNTDNYYHFVYDTLPYLITFMELKKTKQKLKLLMGFPNQEKTEFYKFVIEFLAILDITEEDIVMIDKNTLYSEIYISTSYTHDFDSNASPRAEIYRLYKDIVDRVKAKYEDKGSPKKIYVSRRTWLSSDSSNIGTNYTTRRKLINEDSLVEYLVSKGYKEVFTETLSTEEKINLFSNAESVVGAIGGGICNVLFSNKNCELIALISPYFLDINERFKYSFTNVKLKMFDDAKSVETGEFKTHMRVKVGDVIGEITKIDGEDITIAYSDTTISGWNNEVVYNLKVVKPSDCIKLDKGLNSHWEINLETLKNEL